MRVRLAWRPILAATVSASLILHAPAASALSLLQAYEAALQNDPVYRGATHAQKAGRENIAIGRANLLPNIGANYSKNKNDADITAPAPFTGVNTTTNREYTSHSGVLQLRQPILNLEGIARYRQGIAQANYSDAQFAFQSQDVILRVVSAYAEARYAEDQLAFVTAQHDTYAEQMRVNARMFQLGEGTKTDMLETQARFDLAEAQVLEARDSVATARNTLSAITGIEVTKLDQLSEGFRPQPMQPATIDEWKALALDKNSEIIAARHAVESARHEVSKNRAGHMPRIDAIASLSRSGSETINTLNQEARTKSIGFQVVIPIFSGGSVSAMTSQAVENHERAKADLDAKTNQVLVELRKQYNLVLSGATRIEALNKSVKSAQLLVEATRQSIKGGVRINLDLLNAQQQLFQARRDLAQARYSYMLSYLRLRQAAGVLNADDLRAVAGYFVAQK